LTTVWFDTAMAPEDERRVSTGALPRDRDVRDVLAAGFEQFRAVTDGEVAGYIPVLAAADPDWFAACVASTDGRSFDIGATGVSCSIQSISKPFVFALVCDALGAEAARRALGVNATGLPFDSVMAVELNEVRTMNPMVNAGAIATTSFVPGADPGAQW